MQQIELFPWNENLAVGITLIDDQHKTLVDILNKLVNQFGDGEKAKENILLYLNQLIEYARFHFNSEEAIWERYFGDDVEASKHQDLHRQFFAKVNEFHKQVDSDCQVDIYSELLLFLSNWLAFHILESDLKMAKAIKYIEQGQSVEQAKYSAEIEITGTLKVFIQALLTMFERVSSYNLQLMKEVIERKRAENKLSLIGKVYENTRDGICIIDQNKNIIDVNPAFLQMNSLDRHSILGKNICRVKSCIDESGESSEIWEAIFNGQAWSGELVSRAPSGEIEMEWLTVSSIGFEDQQTNYVFVFSNVAKLLQRQKQLQHIANHDVLTGLPNRLLLMDRLEVAMARARRNNELLAVVYLDLDGFKKVNDELGHLAGDHLLKEIAGRLLQVVRSNDTVARLGGDEFVILVSDLKKQEDSTILLERIVSKVAEPIVIEKKLAGVSASLGVAFYPTDALVSDELLKLADSAMYSVKKSGKANFNFSRVG